MCICMLDVLTSASSFGVLELSVSMFMVLTADNKCSRSDNEREMKLEILTVNVSMCIHRSATV